MNREIEKLILKKITDDNKIDEFKKKTLNDINKIQKGLAENDDIYFQNTEEEEKYYLNEEFSGLPQQIKDELQIMCVLFTEDIGGILTMVFDEEGNLEFKVEADECDLLFDEIGSVLKIKDYQLNKRELLESLELYYRVFFLGEDIEN